ncbi:MAG: membrane protein [Anaerolineales bacterium]
MLNKSKRYLQSMIKPVRWKTFPRDFLRIQIGFALFGLSIALMIQGNLGTGAWGVLEVALAYLTGLTPGTMTVISGFFVLSGALILREQIGWGTLGNILSIGPWLDLFLSLIPSVKGNLSLQIAMLLTAIFLMGNASAIYIGVNAGAGPRDSLMLALKRTRGISVRLARTLIEVTVFTIGWLLGGPAGWGTLAFALLIGPSVQLGFKIYRVEPHQLPVEGTSLDDTKRATRRPER